MNDDDRTRPRPPPHATMAVHDFDNENPWALAVKLLVTVAFVTAWLITFIGMAFGFATVPPQFTIVTAFLFVLIGWMWGLTPGEVTKFIK